MGKRVLLFGTYPIVYAQHGGQKRVDALVEQYTKAGYETKYIGVFDSRFYPDHSDDDIPVHNENPLSPLEVYTSDMTAGEAIAEDEGVKSKVIQRIKEFNPEVIEVEQGFPYIGLKRVLGEINWQGKLVYSSHNIEYRLKRSILEEAADVTEDDKRATIQKLKAMEEDLVKVADIVVACTPSDKKEYESWGAHNVVLAPNGIKKQVVKQEVREKWMTKYRDKGVKQLVLFVGSAHPPNLHGYMEMVGSRIGFLPPDSRILIVGGVSDLIWSQFAQDYRAFCMPLRVDYLGRVGDEDLAALLDITDVIILPITEGGGSNLKTAEAILSNKKVVTTKTAMRSYEAFERLPNIYEAADGEEFRRAIARALADNEAQLDGEEKALTQQVQWKYTLEAAVQEIGNL